MSPLTASVLAIVHGLVAVALLGAITHQTLATWAPTDASSKSFFGRFRAVRSSSFADAIVILYALTAALGAVVYLDFKADIAPDLERDGHWLALGLFDLKEDFAVIGLGLMPSNIASCRARSQSILAQRRGSPILHAVLARYHYPTFALLGGSNTTAARRV